MTAAHQPAPELACWPVRIYWEDTDAGGVVYYANYLKFYERARTEWLRSLGWSQSLLKEQTGGMFVVSQIQTQYLKPAVLDDLLCVTTRIQEAGRASLMLSQTIVRYTDTDVPPALATGAVLCEATVRMGWVQAQTLSPTRIPASVLQSMRLS